MSNDQQIIEIEKQMYDLQVKLNELRKSNPGSEVKDYEFLTLDGTVTLSSLFAGKDKLLLIHNMGQGCRYCTLWADGFNPFVPHLESVMSLVLVSKDDPETQRRFANSRGWRFRTASHCDSDYLEEQSVSESGGNAPGAVFYEMHGDKIIRKNSCQFGPGDIYCSHWSLLGLAGLGESDWTPQYNYWQRPSQLDDGGANVLE